MSVSIERVDPYDDAAFARWFQPYDRAQQADRTVPGTWTLEAQRGIARATDGGTGRMLWVAALDDATPVGALRIDLPQLDNRHTARFVIAVDPACRRQGIGTALLDVALQAAHDEGRTVVSVQVEAGPDADAPGVGFLRSHGFSPALHEVRRDLVLPADEALLAELEASSRRRAADHRVVTWEDGVPEEHLAGRAALAASISTDAPSGDLDVEGEVWDGARVRAAEAQARAMGRRWWSTGAVAPDGSLVAVTELAVDPAEPELLWQWDTVVLPDHRGHALGTLVKVVNLRAALAAWPAARRVGTFNAASNVHMIRVNEAMGFVPVAEESQWQRRLEPGTVHP